jgi:ribosomal protein S7
LDVLEPCVVRPSTCRRFDASTRYHITAFTTFHPQLLCQAVWLLTTGSREAAFRNIKTIAECLSDELINAAKGSSNSYAIKKKDELERVAKSNR